MKKYAVYGVNRVTKDFLYIFRDLKILYCADDIADRIQFGGGLAGNNSELPA